MLSLRSSPLPPDRIIYFIPLPLEHISTRAHISLCVCLSLDSVFWTKNSILSIFVFLGPSIVCNTQQVHKQYWPHDGVKSIPKYFEQKGMVKNENYRSFLVTMDFSFDFLVYYERTQLVFEKVSIL